MNKAYVNQTGGLRLDTDILEFGLEAPKIIQCLGYLAHDLAIISGCTETNNVVSDGYVFVNGEILPFKQSQKNANNTVVIVEEKTKRIFKTGQNREVLFERHCEFGISTQSHVWANFYRVKSLKQLESDIATKASTVALNDLITRVDQLEIFARPFAQGGTMLFWNKPFDQIPAGWREVTAWRGRMPVGWDPDSDNFKDLNTTLGSETHQITKYQLPAVKIGFDDAYYIENSTINTTAISGKIPLSSRYGGTNGTDDDNNTLYYRRSETDQIGNGEEINHMPPSRIVMYIEPIPTV